MSYEIAVSNSEFSELHLLFVSKSGEMTLVNFLVYNHQIVLYDEHGKKFMQTFDMKDLDESSLDLDDSQAMDIFLKFKSAPDENLHLKTKHFEQKQRLVRNLLHIIHVEEKEKPLNLNEQSEPAVDVAVAAAVEFAIEDQGVATQDLAKCDKEKRHNLGSPPPVPVARQSKMEPEPEPESEPGPEQEPEEPTDSNIKRTESDASEVADAEADQLYGLNIPDENLWFIKEPVNRIVVETMLTHKTNGHFYIRTRNDSDSKKYPYALSLKFDDNVVHIKIERTDNGRLVLAPWKKGEKLFGTVDELVQHYQDHIFSFTQNNKQGSISLNRR